MRGFMHALLLEARREHAQRYPWAGRVNYCGGMLDCCGLWHSLEAANDA
jgi:hypothetical protein